MDANGGKNVRRISFGTREITLHLFGFPRGDFCFTKFSRVVYDWVMFTDGNGERIITTLLKELG
ncbi:MAG: hypothetical protein CM15mP73_5530 [Hyphomicrobiales bacterium]|nr:MAG: hypothetical protein CM15mP73_5530 [Hyphomicrobiales bacterium]